MDVRHGRVTLHLRELQTGAGTPLLLLHQVASSIDEWGNGPASWSGPVFGLDFCGHGRSSWVTGGGYTAELLVADADAALQKIGSTAIAGAGLGAYVALLLAGSRADIVPAALLLPGRGLDGGGAEPDFSSGRMSFLAGSEDLAGEPCDPMVALVDTDIRPPDYAEAFGGAARRVVFLEDDVDRPPWWDAARNRAAAHVAHGGAAAGFERLAELVDSRSE